MLISSWAKSFTGANFSNESFFSEKTLAHIEYIFLKNYRKRIHTSFFSFKFTSNLISFYSNVNRTVENRQWKDWKEIERKWKTKIRFFRRILTVPIFLLAWWETFQSKRLFLRIGLIYFGLKWNWDWNWGGGKALEIKET